MKYFKKSYLLSIVVLFVLIVLLIFAFPNNFDAQSAEYHYFKYSILSAIVAILASVLNLILIIYLASQTDKINDAFKSIFSSISETQKNAEFTSAFSIFASTLDGLSHKMLLIYNPTSSESDEIISNFEKFIYSAKPHETLVYKRYAEPYSEIYDAFEVRFNDVPYVQKILEASKYKRFRSVCKKI